MTKQEKQVLERILMDLKIISVPGSAYDGNLNPLPPEILVEGMPNTDLLHDEKFRAGWNRCYQQFQDHLVMLSANREDQIRYAGRPKRSRKQG